MHARRFYLGNPATKKEIDKRLLRIKPPHEFRRKPRSITYFKYWKASGFRAWLLYYSLPVLSGLLPPDYIYHLSLLVSATHTLLGDAILASDIDKAHEMLSTFYSLFPLLYPCELCTINIHCLIHLSKMVKTWGPLWAYSCFSFESMNGHLRKSCHGTRLVLTQMIHTVRMRQLLPLRAKQLTFTRNVAGFIESILGIHTPSQQREIEIKGRVSHKKLDTKAGSALLSANFIDTIHPLPTLPICERVKSKSIQLEKNEDQRVRNSSICIFKHESQMLFGSIMQFCFSKGETVAVIRVFEHIQRSLLDSVDSPRIPELNHSVCEDIDNYIFCVKKLSLTNLILAVPALSLCAKCVHIPLKGSPYDYIVVIPK